MTSCGCLSFFFRSLRRSDRDMKAPSVRDVVGNRPMKCGMPVVSADGLAVAQRFQAKPGDVFISTFPKTGTTWMQQICHQLRTGGHTDFEEISEECVVPWLEGSPSLDIDVTLPQIAEPRCFKSHQRLSALSHLEADGGKFLCVPRDPEASLKSYFKFLLARNPATAIKDVNDFICSDFSMASDGGTWGGTIWQFYTEYWLCRQLPSVKVIAYEHLHKNAAEEFRSINDFLGLEDLDDERLSVVLELTSMPWMSANDHRFDDHHIADRLAKKNPSIPKFNPVTKVGHEVKDDNIVTELMPETKEMLAQAWKERVKPATGCSSYTEMISQL